MASWDGLKLIGNDFIYQQDNASCHTSKESVNWVINEMPDAILPTHWPVDSPDLNSLDYFFWNEVSQRLTEEKFSNRHELITKIKETVKEIPLKFIRDAIDKFRSRIYAAEKNKEGLILNEFK